MLALEILFLYVGCTLAMMLHEEVQEILLDTISSLVTQMNFISCTQNQLCLS